ncbi:hypothetical protein EYF80_020082 [Liparis tanakae]|uniref:Uncharacterized protein n=1 Tax=Liparis tanakae TaxID=230148 RepID=A0A4Z2HVM2_9TELE|nr:hypothetical protein EYF80_020082 [Liparis tanakae]
MTPLCLFETPSGENLKSSKQVVNKQSFFGPSDRSDATILLRAAPRRAWPLPPLWIPGPVQTPVKTARLETAPCPFCHRQRVICCGRAKRPV